MGQWGFYDDEGDSVADMASEIERMVLPKELHRCYQYDKIVKIPCKELKNEKTKKDLINKIIKDFSNALPQDKEPRTSIMIDKRNKSAEKCHLEIETEKTARCFVDKKKYLETHREELGAAILKIIRETENYQRPSMIAGIAMYLARNWHSTPIFPAKFHTVNRGYGLPKELPAKFPEKLRKMAYEASKEQLETFDNEMGWKESEKRLTALKNQMRLFS